MRIRQARISLVDFLGKFYHITYVFINWQPRCSEKIVNIDVRQFSKKRLWMNGEFACSIGLAGFQDILKFKTAWYPRKILYSKFPCLALAQVKEPGLGWNFPGFLTRFLQTVEKNRGEMGGKRKNKSQKNWRKDNYVIRLN